VEQRAPLKFEPSARCVRLRGVRVHNLKNIDLDLPLGRLVVFTGVSGSGKSSLAFDTLYAEGQRRYVETFSAYTRQFLERLDKPDADLLENIPPAIAVAQRGGRWSARSTVGTVTEIQHYLTLLYARGAEVACLTCGRRVRPADPESVAQEIDALPAGTKYLITYPMEIRPDTNRSAVADLLREDGFTRIRNGTQVLSLESGPVPTPADGAIEVVVDRMTTGSEATSRRLDSIETAFEKGLGRCLIAWDDDERLYYRGWRCGHCGRNHEEPDPRLFSHTSPLGACRSCEGLGRILQLDIARIVPDPSKSLRDNAIVPWAAPPYSDWNAKLLVAAAAAGIAIDKPFVKLKPEAVSFIVDGSKTFPGLKGFFQSLEKKIHRPRVRAFLSRWRGYVACGDCRGSRLRPEALAARISGLDVAALSALPIAQSYAFLSNLEISDANRELWRQVLDPALTRLDYLVRIGLGYLTLDREARSLSAGEAQRVSLTGALGSGLVNTLYIFDEPTVGLHPQDGHRLIEAVADLRNQGNSVIVVEHDSTVLNSADWLIDIGPGAGEGGGRIVYEGPPSGISAVPESATGVYLGRRASGSAAKPLRREPKDFLTLVHASGHNLKGIDVRFPLGVLCVVTGVSGAGKSTLVSDTLYPALSQLMRDEALAAEPYTRVEGADLLQDVLMVDQSPIGRSGRSNPVIYVGAFDLIRKAFAETHEAKVRNYGPGRFSFNREGGRCNACEGSGFLTIDMQFLADVMLRCPECKGTRYRPETLEVTYRGKNIAEVLELTVREAFGFFRNRAKIQLKLRPLMEVGLDYLRLGQPSPTLSGGEAQRLKLASFLSSHSPVWTSKTSKGGTLFLFDEPTTGLHPADIVKLLEALNRLVDAGHSLIIVEHSPEVMIAADWIIDLGPGAGVDGGTVVAEGPPEVVARTATATGNVLAELRDLKTG
jgi:excinuclease ABC subunit A